MQSFGAERTSLTTSSDVEKSAPLPIAKMRPISEMSCDFTTINSSSQLRAQAASAAAAEYRHAARTLHFGMTISAGAAIACSAFCIAVSQVFLSASGHTALGIISVLTIGSLLSAAGLATPLIAGDAASGSATSTAWRDDIREAAQRAGVQAPLMKISLADSVGASIFLQSVEGPVITVGATIHDLAEPAARRFISAHEVAHLTQPETHIRLLMSVARVFGNISGIAASLSVALTDPGLAIFGLAATHALGKASELCRKTFMRALEIKADLQASLLTQDPQGAGAALLQIRGLQNGFLQNMTDKLWMIWDHPSDKMRVAWIAKVWSQNPPPVPEAQDDGSLVPTRSGMLCALALRRVALTCMTFFALASGLRRNRQY